MIFAPPPPPVAAAPVWLAQPTPDELSLSRQRYSGGDLKDIALQMRCYVQADGRLIQCQGDDALVRLQDRYRIDRARDPSPTVTVTERFPKLYDKAVRMEHRPSADELKAFGGRGPVAVSCRVPESGVPNDCEIVSHTVHLPTSEAAALQAATLYHFAPATLNDRPVTSFISFTVGFGGAVITNPNWNRKPTLSEIGAAYPAAAYAAGVEGVAYIGCQVTVSGAVDACRVEHEEPQGYGFGGAALRLMPQLSMKPATIDGVPVGGASVTIPINFKSGGGGPPPPTSRGGAPIGDAPVDSIKAMTWTPFVSAPTAEAMAAAYPSAAAAAKQTGRVGFRCGVGRDGALRSCDMVLNTLPAAHFDRAARTLLPQFKVDMAVAPTQRADDLLAPVFFDFSDRSLQPSPDRFVRQLDWVRGLTADDVVSAYPPQAVNAGALNGVAILECRIAATGALEACTAQSETPAGLGFSEAALAIAGVMRANLWTRDGEPVVGAKVRLPIRLIYKASAPEPTPSGN